MTQVLGLCGPAGSGKTTLAKLLISQHAFHRINFADPLKEMLQTLVMYQGLRIGHAKRMFWEDLKEEPSPCLGGRTPRHAMQMLGTEWGRQLIAPDLWIKVWYNRVQKSKAPIVVDDVRHVNEAEAVWKAGGKMIRIERPRFGPGSHTSETEYTQIIPDRIITNNGAPEDMLAALLLSNSLRGLLHDDRSGIR